MRGLRQHWRAVVFCLVCSVALIWIVWPLEPFRVCIHNRKNFGPYQTLRDEHFLVNKLRLRLRLHTACVVDAAEKYQTGLLVLSGILVAGFTGTLWWSTSALVRVSQDQHTDTLRSIRASEDTAKAAMNALPRPWVIIEVFSHTIKPWTAGQPIYGYFSKLKTMEAAPPL
jgi:hypothetical protein